MTGFPAKPWWEDGDVSVRDEDGAGFGMVTMAWIPLEDKMWYGSWRACVRNRRRRHRLHSTRSTSTCVLDSDYSFLATPTLQRAMTSLMQSPDSESDVRSPRSP